MGQKTVMIIEDDESIRESLETILTEEGYQVYLAENGERGLQILSGVAQNNQCLPQLILLDLNMPVMSGAEFLKVQKSDDALKSIPVAVFTAAGNKVKPELAEDFIKKPIHLDGLLDIVQKYCA